jgi:hypothetical protein
VGVLLTRRSEGRGYEGPRRAERAAEAGVEVDDRELGPREPAKGARLRGPATHAYADGRDHEVAQVEVPVSGLVAPRRDRVHVDIERARRRRVESEALDAGFLAGLAEGDVLAHPFSGLRVAAGLEPTPELPVVEEKHPVARRRHHDRAARQMSLGDAAIERIEVAVAERDDLRQVSALLGVPRPMAPERGAEGRITGGFRGATHSGPIYAGRGEMRGARAGSGRAHDLLHGRAVGRQCQQLRAPPCPWHTQAMGLGRTTRFAPLPAGARRVSVMRAGAAGVKVLAPSVALLTEFQARKRALVRAGAAADAAHAAAHREMGYRERYLKEIRARPGALPALRQLIAAARTRDVYLMCMCRYRTPGRACHTYALLDLARELDPSVRQLAEPAPRGVTR